MKNFRGAEARAAGARGGESPSVLPRLHRQRLSHWPSLQSSSRLHFAARKIPHPPSGCRKRSYGLWMRRRQKQRADCGVGRARGRGASARGPRCRQPRSWGTRGRRWELGQVPTQGSAVAHGKWPLLSHPNLFLCSFVRGRAHPALARPPMLSPSGARSYRGQALPCCRGGLQKYSSHLISHPSWLTSQPLPGSRRWKRWVQSARVTRSQLNAANAALDSGSTHVLLGGHTRMMLRDRCYFLLQVPHGASQAHI